MSLWLVRDFRLDDAVTGRSRAAEAN